VKGVAVLDFSSLQSAHLAAPALAIAFSPLPVGVALVLLIDNVRPRLAGIAYLLGRSLSIAVVTTGFAHVPRIFDHFLRPAPSWNDWVILAVGVALMAVGTWRWQRRTYVVHRARRKGKISRITPVTCAAIGCFPPLANPKVLAASAVAGAAISTVHLTAVGTAVDITYYTALANLPVAVPVLTYLIVGPRIDPHLEQFRRWIQRYHPQITAIILIAVGGAMVLSGI
jgi:hypothetical protein